MQMLSLISEQVEEKEKWIKYFSYKYGFKFLLPNFERVPFASQFFEKDAIKKEVSNVEQYLLLTCPINTGFVPYHFESRILRREGFTKEEFTNYEKYNKLAINRWGVNLLNLILLRRELKLDYLHISSPKGNVYGRKSFEEKVKMIECFDSKLYGVLENLYNDYKSQ